MFYNVFNTNVLRGAEQMEKETFIKSYLNMTAEQREDVKKTIYSFQTEKTYCRLKPAARQKDSDNERRVPPLRNGR